MGQSFLACLGLPWTSFVSFDPLKGLCVCVNSLELFDLPKQPPLFESQH